MMMVLVMVHFANSKPLAPPTILIMNPLMFPPPGEQVSVALQQQEDENAFFLVMRHGSSLSLMTSVSEFLANPMQSDTFNYMDPTADHCKWEAQGMTLYYACVVDGNGAILCALRAATEGITDSTKRNKKFLIDYVYTDPSSRDKGIASVLVKQVLEMAEACGASCFVLSLEQTAVYWMEKHGFFLCQSPSLNSCLNLFPDTHLLRRGDPSLASKDDDDEEQQGEATSDSSEQAAFTAALQTLLAKETVCSAEMNLCLHSLSLLVKNAMVDDANDGGRRRQVRINNPHVHRKVFAVGADQAMNVLLASGFDLQVDEQGDAILQFHPTQRTMAWLPWAVTQLQQEANK